MSSIEDEVVNWNRILQEVLTITKSLVKDLLEARARKGMLLNGT